MKDFDLEDRRFWLADQDEIKRGETTDTYFLNTKDVLRRNNADAKVSMEVYARDLPYPENWGVFTGVYEVAKLLEGLPIDVWSFDEGSVFVADSSTTLYEPLMVIRGWYGDFAEYENPILGLLSSATSISTRAARFRVAAGRKLLLSFGTRRVHPALAPLVERSCYVAGFDGASNVLGARLLGIEASGTMPHALVQIIGKQGEAWRLFDKTVSKGIRRIALVDTFSDEKTEAVEAYETLGKNLWGVRIDTPASRRGDFKKIIEEVRWELNIRGGNSVRLIASGKLDEEMVKHLSDVVDGFGVGTAVAYPPVIDLSAKIVEVEKDGKRYFRGKRGGLGGRKVVYRSNRGLRDTVLLADAPGPPNTTPLLKPLLQKGEIVRKYEGLQSMRARIAAELKLAAGSTPSLSWG